MPPEDVIEAPAVAPAPPAAAPAAAAPATATAPPAPSAAQAASGTPAASPAPEPAPPANWYGDDWREKMAGTLAETATPEEKEEHTKLLGRLKRLNTPADVAKAIREQDKLITSGTLKPALPKNPTEAQLKDYRKSHGIPEAPDKYDFAVPKDLVLSEHDEKMLKDVAATMHAAHATPEQVKAMSTAYFGVRTAIVEQMEAANTTAKQAAIEELRSEWGSDYLPNTQGVTAMLGQMDSEAAQFLLTARTPDGIELRNLAPVLRALAGQARELGYVGATVVPMGGDSTKATEDRLSELQKMMGDENSAYRKGPQAEKLQKEYRELLERQDRQSKR